MGKGLDTGVQRPRIWDRPMLGIAWETTHKPFKSEPICTMETQRQCLPGLHGRSRGLPSGGGSCRTVNAPESALGTPWRLRKGFGVAAKRRAF